MTTFDAVALGHETDKSSDGHGYMDAYERILNPELRTILEIGVASGGSLRMWSELFPHAHVVGVDLAPACRAHATKDITVIAAGYRAYRMPPKSYPPVELDDPETALAAYRLDLLPRRERMGAIENCGQMDVWFQRDGASW